MSKATPKLRGEIDAAPANRNGENYYILHDRSGTSRSRLLLSPLGLLIAGRLDGTASILEIADALSRETPWGVGCREVEMVASALEQALFLDDARFQDFAAQAERDFLASAVRPAGSAGSAYNADQTALAADLDRILREAPPPEETPSRMNRHPRGIVIPHLDYQRGAPGYGQAYRLLASLPKPKTIIIVGTAHMPLRERVTLCEKDFDTPLGKVGIAHGMITELRKAVGKRGNLDRDGLAHLNEHSVELQAVWLRHIYGEDAAIVPLLAAPLSEFLVGRRAPEEAEGDPVLRTVAECLGKAASSGETMILASADLAHVGPRFGEDGEAEGQLLAAVEETDRKYLAAVSQSAGEGLAALAKTGENLRVCGSAAIFILGLALAGARTTLLGYHQAITPEMGEAVTYAAMIFE
ncbi:MAG: AmmeMemoRadiSam system protein B [Planctomycetota bacterium]|jgi:AmmeMemoRadiSam system protein B|nr:AmmeMemoRadiSam system protein B [Planctomycetota bacterium]